MTSAQASAPSAAGRQPAPSPRAAWGLAAGNYTLTFSLVEGPEFDTLNTAAGLDNVSVEYTAVALPPAQRVPLP